MGKREVISCSANQSRCDDQPVSQRLRSYSNLVRKQANEQNSPETREKHVNFKNAPVLAAKRNRRFFSIPASIANEYGEQSVAMSSVPAKRQRRLDSTTPKKISAKTREKHENFENAPILAAKRNRRFSSIPASIANEYVEQSVAVSSVPAKRQLRFASTTPKILKTPSVGGDDNSLSSIIALNCKLTNEVLLAKKQLSEKYEAMLKMQQTLLEKSIECLDLHVKVQKLERLVEQLRSERFCNDLIELEDNSEEAHGNIRDMYKLDCNANLLDVIEPFDVLHNTSGDAQVIGYGNNTLLQNTNDTEDNQREKESIVENMNVEKENEKSTSQLNTDDAEKLMFVANHIDKENDQPLEPTINVVDTLQAHSKSDTGVDVDIEVDAENPMKSKGDDEIARNANDISEENGKPKRLKTNEAVMDRGDSKSYTKDNRQAFEWTPFE